MPKKLDGRFVSIEDSVSSTNSDQALSANQGRVLNNQHIALRESVAELDINPIIYDDFGDANCMVRVPKFRLEDIDASLGTGIHPAFIVNGVEKDAIYYGQYLASVKGSNYVSVPNADPANTIDFDESLAACAAKGDTLGNPATTSWIMADNSVAELSKQDLIDIEDAYAIRQREVFSEYQTLCEQVAVSDDPESILF